MQKNKTSKYLKYAIGENEPRATILVSYEGKMIIRKEYGMGIIDSKMRPAA